MSPETDELLQKAMTLPLEARAELACSLIDSLDESVDEDAEVAWQQEVARRMDEIRSGKVKTIPWREVQRKGRALLHGK
ncbi:MAG: addiction module protein [Candidatus Sulfotelmatobacter sp.]|jgi:putative addiction module component (TIGR02574 family)